ncbi:hypothetical protein ACU8M5_10450 [Rhizobium leguminosarum]
MTVSAAPKYADITETGSQLQWSQTSADVGFLTTSAFARPSKLVLATWTVTARSHRQRDGPVRDLVDLFRASVL